MANEIYHRSNWGNAVNDKYWADVYEKYSATNKMYIRSDYYENSNVTDKLMADIYPKPSILLTPTAYDNGKLNSVKPVGGENLLLQSNQFDTTWVKSGGITLTSGQAGYDESNNAWLVERSAAYNNIYQSNSSFFTPVSTISVYAKAGTYNFLRLALAGVLDQVYFNLTDGSLGVNTDLIASSAQSVGNGWWRLSATFKDTAASGIYIQPIETDGGVGNAGTGSIYIQDAQLERGSEANTYIETTTTAKANGDFNFSRGSSATRVNEKGLIEDVQILSGELVQNGDFEQIGSEEVTNGDFSQIGSEKIVNGDFATDSNWNKQTGWSISGGVAIGTNSNSYLFQGAGMQSNKVYKITFDLVSITNGAVRPTINGITNVYGEQVTTIGTNTQYIVASSNANANVSIQGVSNFSGSIDNVSVKEVGQDWTFGTGWSISGGKAISDGTSGSHNLTQGGAVTVGKTYKITITVSDYVSGNVQVSAGAAPRGTMTANGTYTFYQYATPANSFYVIANSFEGSIDNVSVKEVGQNWSSYDGNVIFKQGSVQIDTNGTAYTEFRAGNDFNSPDAILTIGNKYRLTYTISESNSGEIKTNSLIANDTILTSTVGTHTIEGLATLTSLGILRNGDTDITITNISVIEITDDTDLPRINYTNFDYENGEVVPYSGTGSLLLEGQSTNLITYSEDFSQSVWVKSGTSVVSGFISPDGTENAYKLVESSANEAHTIKSNTASVSSLATTTKSIIVKPNGRRWIALLDIYKPSSRAWFDLELGVKGSLQTSAISSKIEKLSNGYFRCSVTSTVNGTLSQLRMDIVEGNNITSGYQGDGESGVYLWGAMLEEGSFATSYIPTNGSTVTRLADVCNNAASSDLINSTEGVLYAEISALTDGGSDRYISLSDGSSSNIVSVNLNTISNRINLRIASNGVNIFIDADAQSQTELNKVAIKYKSNDCSFWINGVKINSNTTISHPLNLSKMSFNVGDGGFPFYGNVKTVAVFKEALDNDQLERLTGEGYETFNLLAQANNYTII